MLCLRLWLALLLGGTASWSFLTWAEGVADAEPLVITGDVAPVMHQLFQAIESLSDYRAGEALPPVYQLPQYRIEERVCDEPCDVRAAYIPREGIFLSGNLDPLRDPLDRAVLLHELVHYLQQGHPKFIGVAPCERERTKEQEAFAIQNAYLATLGRSERAVFYDDFDCESRESDSG
jgi:hypothetical protein